MKMSKKTSNIVNVTPYSDVNPVECGSEVCNPGHFFGPAVRTYWLLHFVVSGKGTFQTSKSTYTLVKNQIFIIRPYEINTYTADTNDPWEYIWIGFRAGITLPPAFTMHDTVYAPELLRVFREALNAPEKYNYEAFLCSRIWEIISFMSAEETPSEAFEMYIRPALNIMETEYPNGIKVNDIAERLHINRSYFSSLFNEVVGKPPHEYLTELRMEKAIKLMRSNNYSITVTANSVGFSDVFAFSRAFKKRYGISPSDFKQQITAM